MKKPITATWISSHNFVALLFLVVVPLIAHLQFSWMGFAPIDDGFILAYSRRLLAGQVPHRDFISIRPVFSALFHIPFVLWGGNYTYWVSRLFVWFQFAVMAWIWTGIISRALKTTLSPLLKWCFALLALAFSVHIFPIMAWHTVDGLFFSSLGLLLCLRESQASKMMGYILLGLAYLCKQSFIFIAPVTLMVLGDWQRLWFCLAAMIPGVGYMGYLLVTGAFPDAILQLTAQAGFFAVAVNGYLRTFSVPWGILVGYWSMRWLVYGSPTVYRLAGIDPAKVIGLLVVLGLPVIGGVYLSRGTGNYVWIPAYGLFGTALGVLLFAVINERERVVYIQTGILVLLTAWSTSISIGYNSPALGAGLVMIFVLITGYQRFIHSMPESRVILDILTVVVTVIGLLGFVDARHKFIYFERPARDLTYSLNGVLPGAWKIKTNENTYRFFVDLQDIIAQAERSPYCILPDLAGYWVKAPQLNPLPLDWAWTTEVSSPPLFERFTGSLQAQRGNLLVILQKVSAFRLAHEFKPLAENYDDYYGGIITYVRTHFEKVGETEFFDLYR